MERIIPVVITTAEILRVIAGCLGLAAIVIFLRALFSLRRSTRAAYYSVRREARQNSSRSLAAASLLTVIGIFIAVASVVVPSQRAAAPPIIAANATSSPGVQPTIYIVPSSTPVASATFAPSPTPPPATPHAVIVTRAATPANDKYLSLLAISNQIDASGLPISPTMEFTKGVSSVYVVFDYANVPTGALLRHTWYREGSSVHFDSLIWTREATGTAYITWSPEGGLDAGLYEVRVMLSNTRQFSANFVVR